MRINVYSQELTKEFEVTSKASDTGITYYGVRMFLASPDVLHHTKDDDDRSAITFWLPNAKRYSKGDFAQLLYDMADAVLECPDPERND